MPRLSVIIPAHNEQDYLPTCLRAVEHAAHSIHADVEVIVVANRCTDDTIGVAQAHGALIVRDESRSLGGVRNAGAAVARGEILVFIDADSVMAPNALGEIERHLATGAFVGGGAKVVPARHSLGIDLTMAVVNAGRLISGLGAGMYWCRAADFHAVEGFDERLHMGEDLDFARRLREHGRHSGRRFTNLHKAPVVTSCRKYDRFGDWHMFGLVRKHGEVRAAMRGAESSFADQYFYDFNG